ncbi:hypothetical protein VN97_g10450 [Penicillium thymicola]|uniref:Uncharacterized protein n=1 Tax=Penicillium thymicola TaxID=293382 RepID=A0AAI9T9T5_PENTH|nr:hypothetical protein VN97_g10450 [Penicillium thymicola]
MIALPKSFLTGGYLTTYGLSAEVPRLDDSTANFCHSSQLLRNSVRQAIPALVTPEFDCPWRNKGRGEIK